MNIKSNSYSGITLVPIETELLDKRFVYVNGEINTQSADEFVKELSYLALSSQDQPIKLVVNSPGGEIEAGLVMCEAVANCPSPIDVYCYGKAYSMAAVLFEACKGKRYMVGSHSKLMIHKPSVCCNSRFSIAEINDLSKSLNTQEEYLYDIIVERSGMDKDFLYKETEGSDRYFEPGEAVDMGLADGIVSFSDLF